MGNIQEFIDWSRREINLTYKAKHLNYGTKDGYINGIQSSVIKITELFSRKGNPTNSGNANCANIAEKYAESKIKKLTELLKIMNDALLEANEILRNNNLPEVVKKVCEKCGRYDVSSLLPLKDIEKKAKEWAVSRSNGDAEQDEECEYDFKMGMIKARNDLSGLIKKA